MSVELSYSVGPALGVVAITRLGSSAAMLAIGVGAVIAGIGLILFDPPTSRSSGAPAASVVAQDTSTSFTLGEGQISASSTARASSARWLTPAAIAALPATSGATLTLSGTDIALTASVRAFGHVDLLSLVVAAWAFASMVGGFIQRDVVEAMGSASAPRPPRQSHRPDVHCRVVVDATTPRAPFRVVLRSAYFLDRRGDRRLRRARATRPGTGRAHLCSDARQRGRCSSHRCGHRPHVTRRGLRRHRIPRDRTGSHRLDRSPSSKLKSKTPGVLRLVHTGCKTGAMVEQLRESSPSNFPAQPQHNNYRGWSGIVGSFLDL